MLLHAASRPVPFKVEVKRWAQAILQVLPPWLQSPCHGVALRWDSRERRNLTLAPCWLSACCGADGPGGQRRRAPTCPVAAQHLQAHSYSCWGPPLWVHSDVLGRNRVKPPDFRDIIVDVAFKKLQRDRETERERQRERERERER